MIADHLSHNDPILARLVEQYGKDLHTPSQTNSTNFIEELCETIVSQQLSVKAASTIWGRARANVKDWNNPVLILDCDDLVLRQAGLSGQKVSYVKNIARAVMDGTLHPDSYLRLPEQEIIDELVKVKGIGVWTAEMFLLPDSPTSGVEGHSSGACDNPDQPILQRSNRDNARGQNKNKLA